MDMDIDSENIILTKLHRPQITGKHIHRGSLLERLNRHLHQPLVLVSAPAGYGKSTLVSCWLEDCQVPSAWVSLDSHDNSPRIFLSYIVSAVRRLFPAACRETLSLLNLSDLPPVAMLSGRLINELDRIEEDFIMVLDDYHLIRDKSVHALITRILEHPSKGIQLVLIGRRDPPLPITMLRARGLMVEIRTEDLRFSLDETVNYLQQMTEGPVDHRLAAILEKKTEGWVTGLLFAALFLRHGKDIERIIADIPVENRYVMDYVTTEILSKQSLDFQNCLLKISILNRFCDTLCDAVCFTGIEAGACDMNGSKLLAKLVQANLFVIPLDHNLKWFRFHHLFRKLLKRQLQKRFSAKDIVKLYQQAIAWFNENGHTEDALSLAFESRDNEAAAKLVKQHRHDFMDRERWFHLDRWLSKFPADFIRDQPELLLSKAWIYLRHARYAQLFDLLGELGNNSAATNIRSGIDPVINAEVQVLEAFQSFIEGQAEIAEDLARKALEDLPASYHSIRGITYIILALALQMQDDLWRAQHIVYEVLQREDKLVPVDKTMLIAALCYTNWCSADLHSLKIDADALLKHGRKNSLPETIAVSRFFMESCIINAMTWTRLNIICNQSSRR